MMGVKVSTRLTSEGVNLRVGLTTYNLVGNCYLTEGTVTARKNGVEFTLNAGDWTVGEK